MKRSRDPLALSPHWHVDLRIESDLPEDTIIGTRFLVNVGFTVLTLVSMLAAGYFGFVWNGLNRDIHYWERRMNDNRAEAADIMRMQREYSTEAVKIDHAYTLVRAPLYVSEFIANLGRTRPDRLSIDFIEWSDSGIVLRGSLRERSDRATEMLGAYVDLLRKEPKIGPLFRDIVLTDLDRGAAGEALRFELRMSMKPAAAAPTP
jgi:hypothetical protein